MKRVTILLIVGTIFGVTLFFYNQSPEKKFALKFFEKCRVGGVEVTDFHEADDLAQLCVDKIKIRFDFLKELHKKFGEDAVHYFNHSMEGGNIYLYIIPNSIEEEKMVIQEIGDRKYLFGYPNLDLWPISYKNRAKVDLTNYLINSQVDLKDYKNTIRVEIGCLKHGLELIHDGEIQGIQNIRQEMETYMKTAQDKLKP